MPLLLAPVTAPPNLRDRLADLRRRWRGLVLLTSFFLVVAVVVAAAVGLGLLDRAAHLPALIRASALAGLLAAGGLAVLRLRRRLSTLNNDLALALRVEEHFPALNDALASTVQFEHEPAGSPELRQATRLYAVREAEDCDFRELVDRRPVRRALAAAAVAVAAALPLGIFYPNPARVAVVRLLDPFGNHPWPPQTVMTLDVADWLARGEPFVLRASLTGVIPERAEFGFAVEGTPASETPVPVTADDDGGSFAVRLEPNRVTRSFRYRVRANDAETPWRTVRVVTPPQLAPLDGRPSPQVHLTFPAYTDLPAIDLPDGGSSVECVTGTVIRVRAASDRPVVNAWIELARDPPRPAAAAGLLALGAAGPAGSLALSAAGQAVWDRVPARVDGDGGRFEVSFRPYVAGLYLLRFADDTGLAGRRTFDIRLRPDPPPAVTLERPSASQDSFSVLPDATLPLVARIDDPIFAVRLTWLEYRCGTDEPARRIPLYDHAVLGSVPRLLNTAAPTLRLRPQQVPVAQRLDLKQFRHADGRPLQAGDRLTIHVAADDFDDVTVPKPAGSSHEIELHVVGPDELVTALQKVEADVQRELKEMLRLQRDALERTAPAENQRRQTGNLRPDDLEKLVQAEQLQQQLRGRLGNEQEGLRANVDRLRRAMRDNPLPKSPERDRLDAVAADLDRLAREELEPVEPLLAQSRTERGPITPEARKAGPLPKAVEHEREAERTLRDLVDQLQPWTDAREVRADAGALARDQEKAARDRADLESQGLMGKSLDQVPPEQRRQLERLAERQSALADRTSDLLAKVNRKLGENQAGAAAKDAEAAAKEAQAGEFEKQAPGNPSGDETRRQAREMRRQADEAKAAAAAQRREADALSAAREALQHDPAQPPDAAPPPDPSLAGRQKEAAEKLGRNEVGQARQAQEAADRMLKSMQDALREKANPDGDRLAKKQQLNAAEHDLEALIGDQERLQRAADEAGRIAARAQRQQQLERLAREQEQLRQRARDLAQRLTRMHGEQAGQELRRAAREMEQARDAMDQGEPPGEKQEETLNRLDDAQDKLAQNRKEAEEELQREMRAKLLDALTGLKDRQEAQVAESERLFEAAKRAGGWSRPLQKSLADLATAEAALGGELGPLTERHFQDAKVIAHLVREAAEALAAVEPAVETMRDGPMDLDSWEADRRSVQAPQRLGLKRLTQLIDVLKDDEKDRPAGGKQPGDAGQGGSGGGGAAGDGIPPLAQLKLLRALQAEINERTDAFAKAHPELAKLSKQEQAELDAIRKAQADLATLLEEIAPPEPPAGPQSSEVPRRPKRLLVSPEGAAVNSRGWSAAEPPVEVGKIDWSPERAIDSSGDRPFRAQQAVIGPMSPGLSPLAIHGRPFGADSEGAGQEPQPPEPQDRLEKKPRPGEPPPPGPPPTKPADEKEKPKDPSSDDAEKLREKIAQEMQAAEKKLHARDPGPDTRKLQDDALRNIDKLIDLTRNPPPPPSSDQQEKTPDTSPPPKDGSPSAGGNPKPQGGTEQRPQSGQARREKREQRRRQLEQQAKGGGQQPQPGGQQGGQQKPGNLFQSGMGGTKSTRQPDQMADVVKDFWGHLPETLRQDVDNYYRDRFMPRYRDLVQEYYMRLAERDRTRREERK